MTMFRLLDYRKYRAYQLENNWHRLGTRSTPRVEQIFHKSGYLWVLSEVNALLLGWPKEMPKDVY
jgi:hypothetical protein